jgi:hypothetical protein
MSRYTKEERAQALEKLKAMLPSGSTVHCVLRHVSRSGMSRSISVFAFAPGENAPQDITYWASRVLDQPVDNKHGGIRMGGCGMDMGFALVYDLSRCLYPQGFGCIGDTTTGRIGDRGVRCPSNDHTNGDRDYTPHTAGKPLHELADKSECWQNPRGHVHWHNDGGYALRHRWL